MAMKPCIECKHQVSTDAKPCPNCGKKNPTTKVTAKAITGIIMILFVGYCATQMANSGSSGASNSAALANTGPSAVTNAAPVATVSAYEMWQQYDANEVAADNYYKGRVFRIKGTVASIDKDFMDNVVLHLVSPNEFMTTTATMKDSKNSANSPAASLSKGDRVILVCVVKGRIVGAPVLDDCVFA